MASQVGAAKAPSRVGVSKPVDEAYDAWREADAAARTLERQIDETWNRHHRGCGDAPSRELLSEAARQRNIASQKLAHAITLLRQSGLIQAANTVPEAAAHGAAAFLKKLRLFRDRIG